MDISFIGSGNVASHLTKALSEHFNLKYILSSGIKSAKELAGIINAMATDDYELLKMASDIIIICVPDDQIIAVVKQLGRFPGNPVVAHVSGSKPAEVLIEASSDYGVIYPVQTFTKNVYVDLKKVPFFLNGNSKKALHFLDQIASRISPKIYVLNDEARMHLHLAAVMVNNFTNHLFYQTEKFLYKKQLVFEHLEPLIEETIKKAINIGPFNAQTGPARRKDLDVIDAHLHYLKNDEELNELYNTFSQLIIKTYENSKRNQSQ